MLVRSLSLAAVLASLLFVSPTTTMAQRSIRSGGIGGGQPPGSGAYPLVYGATGRPYGPTQSHYQYQRQYGRPWDGQGQQGYGPGVGQVNGAPAYSGNGGVFLNLGWPGYGWGGYPPYAQGYTFQPSTAYFGYAPVPGPFGQGYQPVLSPWTPPVMLNGVQPDPLADPLFHGVTPTPAPGPVNPQPVLTPSTPLQVQQSVRYQAEGDLQLQQLNYLAAADRYRKSLDAAKDRVEPRIRLALTLVGRNRLAEAAEQLQAAVRIDPQWPQRAETLDELIGFKNTLEKVHLKQRVAEWTTLDSRDPQRLFLLGVMLYLDEDPRSQTMLETAIALAGPQDHFVAFLAPRNVAPGVEQQLALPQTLQGNPPAAAPVPQAGGQRSLNVPPPPEPMATDSVEPPTPRPAASPTMPSPLQPSPLPETAPLPEAGENPADDEPMPAVPSEDSGLTGPLLPPPTN